MQETRGESRGVIGKHNLRASVLSESNGPLMYVPSLFFFENEHEKRSYLVVQCAVTLSFSRYLFVSFSLSFAVFPLGDLAVTVTVTVSALPYDSSRGRS